MKILANDGISASGQQKLEAAGFTVITAKVAQADIANYINENGVEVLLVRSATTCRKEVVDACPGLKMVGRGGVGMDNIDVAYATEKGVKVFNTPASSSQSVAELTFAHLFGMVRFLPDSNRQMPIKGTTDFNNLKKAYAKGTELRGKTIGIIGFGRIGQSVAQYALGIGMHVIACDRITGVVKVNIEINGQRIVVPVSTISMEELLVKSDFISIHVPKQSDGKPVLGAAEIAMMKDGVGLINLARGGVIDETALLDALNSGKVGAAALDVFENEPTPNAALMTHSKISLSPHIGAATEEAQDRIGDEIAEIVIDFYNK